jgi:hypothetical protein
MRMSPEDLSRSARAFSDAGAFVERAAHIARPSNSALGRLTAAASAASLGARLLPAGWRLFKRYPVPSALAVGGVVLAVYLARASRMSARR